MGITPLSYPEREVDASGWSEVGDRIYAIVWNADQMVVGQLTYLVEEE